MRIWLALALAVVSVAALGCGGDDYHNAEYGLKVVVDPDKTDSGGTCYFAGNSVPGSIGAPVGERLYVDIRAVDDDGQTTYDIALSNKLWDPEISELIDLGRLGTWRYDASMFRRSAAITARVADQADSYEVRITSITDRPAVCSR